MKKIKYYRYIGRNGTITSPILIDGATKIDMYNLIADDNKILINENGTTTHSIYIYVEDLNQWTEIDDKGQI